MLRTALTKLGRTDLIGNEEKHLVPHEQTKGRPMGGGKPARGGRGKSAGQSARARR